PSAPRPSSLSPRPPSGTTRPIPQTPRPPLPSSTHPPVRPPAAPSPTDDPFPQPTDLAIDLVLDDDGLSTLEKIYLYSRSKASFHRIFIAHALPEYLLQVTPQEAIEYVQPLLNGLAMDDDELVKEALAAELVPVIWWFFTHCQIIPDNLNPEETYASSSTTVTISVQAFTPILGTLLLSSNPLVGGAARFAVVDLLSRMKKADDRELGAIHRQLPQHSPGEILHPWEIDRANLDDEDDDEPPLVVGLFGSNERSMFTEEILQQVVIGMGRLDVDCDYDTEVEQTAHAVRQEEPNRSLVEGDNSNPYFPPIPAPQQTYGNYTLPYNATNAPQTSSPQRSSHSPSPSNAFSPGMEFPPSIEESQALSARQGSGLHGGLVPIPLDTRAPSPSPSADEQAAVGRLSSMSLMAAVTASGTLGDETQRAFVKELERVGRDPVYWVRREASFALGALAKVVPEEVVHNSLLPLFEGLRWDSVWHVRHSALFALPAILSRLSPAQRRTVALETIVNLSQDPNSTVRLGVLEALGEVIHTFHIDADGPPGELIDLFLGRREDKRVRDGQQQSLLLSSPEESFYTDPKRHLICAFNFPAVALTLGGERWGELRATYLQIALDDSPGVHRTLAASLGELAKIIGPENAKKDLVGQWWSSIQTDDEEVRSRGIESTPAFIEVIGKEVGMELVQGMLTAWKEGKLRGWRERELIVKTLLSWVTLIDLDSTSLARAFLVTALEDNVAAVREAAISIVPDMYSFVSSKGEEAQLLNDLQNLAKSTNYRRRMTFIACQQALILATEKNGQPLISCDDDLLRSVADLANDAIEGVRIGISRFAALAHENFHHQSRAVPSILHDLVQQLSQDSSHEVRSYIAELSLRYKAGDNDVSLASSRGSRKRLMQLATFSRPPPAPSPSSSPSISIQQSTSESGTPGQTSSSSGEVSSVLSSDSSVGCHDTAGMLSLSSPNESIRALEGARVSSEDSKQFADPPPSSVIVTANGVYQEKFPDMEERYRFEFDDGTRSGSAGDGMTVPG
ncbi:ARM repeat-containing protein, partial [Pholiota conissans]